MENENWEQFGKKIWDAAMNAHKHGTQKIEIPFSLPDGAIASVTVNIPRYLERYMGIDEDGVPLTKWRHGVKMSDGTMKWED